MELVIEHDVMYVARRWKHQLRSSTHSERRTAKLAPVLFCLKSLLFDYCEFEMVNLPLEKMVVL